MNDEVEAFKELLAQSMGDRQQERTIAQMREGYETLGGAILPGEDWQCESVDIAGLAGELSHSGNAKTGTVLYLHGGGYVIGSLVTHRGLVANLGRSADCRVLAIDYRLAPEHAFPAPVEDAVKAYKWLLEQGTAETDIVIAGDSAGGGLTVATLLQIKAENLPMPAAGVCLSPWVDMEVIGASMETKASEDPMVQRAGLLTMAATYLNGADSRNPLASPIYGDLGGLPPLLIQVGTAETLLDDARRLAIKAIEHGVNVDYEEWPDMIHVFQHFAPLISDGFRALDKIGDFVKHHAGN